MASTSLLDRPIQLRHEDEEELASSDQDVRSDNGSVEGSSSSSAMDSEHEAQDATSETEGEDEEEGTALKDISFGALAKAQETFKPAKSRKRKLSDTLEEEEQEIEGPRNGKQSQEDFFDTRQRSKEARVDVKKRTSKHAPAVESARKPVSRKRFIFEPSQGDKFRDPRFDAAVMSGNPDRSASQKANKNYSFLSEYQAAEILELKSQIKKAKDPSVISNLKRQVMSLESKIRNAEAQQRESEIRKKHKEKEREALRAGEKSKPYYLKDADVKKLVKEDRLQGMGKRARDKAEKRRMKREKGKEARDMPRVRRER